MQNDKRKELEERVANAQSIEEAKAILAESGAEMSEEQAELLHTLAKQIYEPSSRDLSLEELQAVAGGVTDRNWLEAGCAATVESGSSCWFTDGGCSSLNINYSNLPAGNCPSCGKWGAVIDKEESRLSSAEYHEYKYRYTYHCHFCGHTWQEITLKTEPWRD